MGTEGSLSINPARLGPANEQVLVQEAFTQLRVVLATFETVTEQKLVSPGIKMKSWGLHINLG
ncbi:MAG: hypothetical protein ACJA01_003952 [Saprospiraceae bacterium]|jgi:hypothetical protein